MTLESAVIEVGSVMYPIVMSLSGLLGGGALGAMLVKILYDFCDLPNHKTIQKRNHDAIKRYPAQWSKFISYRKSFVWGLALASSVVVTGLLCFVLLMIDTPLEKQGVKVLNINQSVAAIAVCLLAVLGLFLQIRCYKKKKVLDKVKMLFAN